MRKRILVVCFGNTCRSPMLAELLWRTCIEQNRSVIVSSAGYGENAASRQCAAREWSQLRDETEINLDLHRSQWIGALRLDAFDLIICAEQAAVDAVIARGAAADKIVLANAPDGIPNPWQQGVDAYRQCFAQLRDTIVPALIPLI